MHDDQLLGSSLGHAHPNPEIATDTDYSPPRGNPFPIVGIGASAGGLEAFKELLSVLPADPGMAFVLVQHLDPQHESQLAEILAVFSKIPVVTVEDGVRIEPNHVFVIPPNTSMELEDGLLRLSRREPGLHLPIDIFFRSLAQVQGSRAIGVVLSGNASDGSNGVRAIKAECGITFAQDEQTARYGGMPHNAISTGAVDFVLPPADIGRELVRLGQHEFMVTAEPGVAESETLPEGDGELKRILGMVQVATKVDFSQYKHTTIQRRVGRRMMVLRLDTLEKYATYLQQQPAEIAELYKDLLINVTSFFRDPRTFDALVKQLTTALEKQPRRQDAIRIWVPGCSTGEEVYSIAIRLHEFLAQEQLPMTLQLFGTDISETALERARQGVYGAIIRDSVSEERLRRFFTKMDSGYQINKLIRELCVFARHDITRGPPFSHLDIVSCRNVLIYLDVKAQKRILPAFHYALSPTGLLMLGSAETPGAATNLFTVVDKAHHIYGRKAVPTRLVLDFSSGVQSQEPAFTFGADVLSPDDLRERVDRVIQSRYSPDGVVVNRNLQILQFRGHTAPFFDAVPGEATLNLLRMARESLVLPLRRAIQKAIETDLIIRDEGASFNIDGHDEQVSLEITPIVAGEGPDRYFLIVFHRIGQNASRATYGFPAYTPRDEASGNLQRELGDMHEYLRNMREAYEVNAEELRAANEEARSANEELQSTNEELGTTTEELQSTNEELTTVNEELQNRNRELAATNSDLGNVLAAVTVAVVMVDQDLRVRRFNSAAEKLLELGPVDVGRPIGHLRGQIETPRLEAQVQEVIENLDTTTDEIQDVNGCWYQLSVRPYRTVDERIAGAVITFQSIDLLKRGLQASEEARENAEALIETVREPLVVIDSDLRVQRATAAFYENFLVSREETEGHYVYDLGNGQWNQPRLRELLGCALLKSEPFQDYEIEHDFPHLGRRTMRLNARRIPHRDQQKRLALLSIEDVTERREIAEIRYQRLFETAKDGIILIDVDGEAVQDVNPFFIEMTGASREDFIGKPLQEAGRLLRVPEIGSLIETTREAEVVRYEDLKLTRRDGTHVNTEAVANLYHVGSQPIIQVNLRDVSSRKQSERALQASEERFRTVVESVRDYAIFQLDGAGKIVTWNRGAERVLGWKEQEAIGQNSRMIFTPEDRERGEFERELETARTEGRAIDERWHLRKDGSRFFASGVLSRAPEGNSEVSTFTKVMQDITQRKQQEDQLKRSLEEKSMLVREIHHRVKNNLQMIVSLLSLQSSHTNDAHVVAAFDETESRVRAIAHVHEQLYASEDLTTVEIGGYVAALAREVLAIHARDPEGVRLDVQADEITMHIERATPLGLIANELMLNSLKHALAAGRGELRITLKKTEQRADGTPFVLLSVQDSGPGFPSGFDPVRAESMGYRLVNLLVRQLRARLEVRSEHGAEVTLLFPMQSSDT